MEIIHFVPPIISLAIATAWLTSQNRSLNKLEQECVKLREVASQQPTIHHKKGTSPNWRKIAAEYDATDNDQHFRKLASEMSDSEICKALNDIADLDISVSSYDIFKDILNEALADENPEMALNEFMKASEGRLLNGRYPAMAAFENFLKRDYTAAIAWFDREIEAGSFDRILGVNRSRVEFEQSRQHPPFPTLSNFFLKFLGHFLLRLRVI